MPNLTEQDLDEYLPMMGVSRLDFNYIQSTNNLEESSRRLDDFKDRAKKGYRRAALELHPDKTNNDEKKTAQFKMLSTIWEWISELRVQPAQQPVQMIYINLDSTSTDTWTWWY